MNIPNTAPPPQKIASKAVLPDITSDQDAILPYAIDQVGMGAMEIIAKIPSANGPLYTLPSHVDVYVDVHKKESKGIHMSRLYTLTHQFFMEKSLSPVNLGELLDQLITSQKGISTKAFLNISFTYPIIRPALISTTQGVRHYPINLTIEKEAGNQPVFKLRFTLTYSSACPCSAALAKQYINNQLHTAFPPQQTLNKAQFSSWLAQQNVLAAIPHSQRSFATIALTFKTLPNALLLATYIDPPEKTLATAVQTSVKREDEQDFARINGENLMFCEDAARILYDYYAKTSAFSHFAIKVSHQESLHAHNAVAKIEKSL